MTQRLHKINKPHKIIGSRPKLEPLHKWVQGPTNIKTKQATRTKWGVYSFIQKKVYVEQPPILRILKNQIMFINFKKLYMDKNKLLEFGMKGFQNFLWEKDF